MEYTNPNGYWMPPPDKDMSYEDSIRHGCFQVALYMIAMAVMLVLCALFSGCATKQKVVTVTETRTDTTYITKWQHDSIFRHDSVYVNVKGDTVLIERWHTHYIEKVVHDTLLQHKTDSVPVPCPVTEYVEKSLSWWQRTQMYAGDVLLVLLAGLLGFGGYKIFRLFV